MVAVTSERVGDAVSASELPFDVILDRDRASAEDVGGALLAARTLVSDLAARGGSSRLLRQELIVTRDGIYDGKLTNAARAGASTCGEEG